MAFYDKFPYTNFQEINLDRLVQELIKVKEGLNFVIENASLKYADPIQWNITHQYQANTVVIDPATGIAYISTKPVPDNILITNTGYWSPIFDLSRFFESTEEQIEALQTAIDALNQTTETQENDIQDLKDDTDNLAQDITRIDADIANIRTEITAKSGIYAKVILPILSLDADPTGSCMIYAKGGHAVLIDLGLYTNYPAIKQAMIDNDVTTIDYIFITHYHGDHTATNPNDPQEIYNKLKADFDCSNLVCYIPKTPSTTILDVSWIYNALTQAFHCITTDNNTSVTWYDIIFTVSNASDADVAYYNANTTDYNDFSNLIRANYKGVQMLNTGDIGPVAQKRCYEQGYAEPAELITIPHHGVNPTADADFMNHIKPLYAYVSNGSLGYVQARDPNVYRAAHYGKVFDNRSNRTEPVIFGLTESGFIPNGTPLEISGYSDEMRNIIYCNPSIIDTAFQDGTSLYPFKYMRRAINECYGISRIEVLGTSTETLVVTNNNGLVEINGNNNQIGTYLSTVNANCIVHDAVIAGGMNLTSGSYVKLLNVSHAGTIQTVESELIAESCTVTADVDSYTGIHSNINIVEPYAQTNPSHHLVNCVECVVNGHLSLGRIAARSVGYVSNARGVSDLGRLADTTTILLAIWKENPPLIVFDTTANKYARIVNGAMQYIG